MLFVKVLSLSGQATKAFCVHGFSSTQKKICGQTTILQVFCVLPGCEVPARLLQVFNVACVPHPGMARESYVLDTDNIRALRGTGVWTAWYMRWSCAQDARGCGHVKMNGFFPISKNNFSVLRNQNDVQLLQNTLWIYGCRKLFTYIGNYFPILVIISPNLEILDKCHFSVPDLLYWHGLTLIPAWISNHMPGKIWDEIAYTFPNYQCVKRHRWDSDMDKCM